MRRHEMNRRAALGLLGGAGLSLVAAACGNPDFSPGEAIGCATRPDFEGPFFKAGAGAAVDLTQLGPGDSAVFRNPVVKFRLDGTVLGGAACNEAVSGATVDIWHADPDGHYDVKESSPGAGDAVLDDEVQIVFRTQLSTNENGQFSIVTYVPFGYYDRPQHIHLKMNAAGHDELITQLYIDGDPKWDNVSSEERDAIDGDRTLTLTDDVDAPGKKVASVTLRLPITQ